MIVKARNTIADNVPKTFLTHDEAAGATTLRWKNPNGFAAKWGVQVGETGEEQTEIVVLGANTPAGTAGTLTGATSTSFEHPADTPLYAIKWDQIVFEVSTAGTAGTAAALTDGTLTHQADQKYTQFDHTAGATTYAYKTYYRSSALAANSTESDWITTTGFSFYSLAKMRQRVKDKLWDASFVEDGEIDDWLNEWREKMVNTAIDVNEDFLLGTVDIGYSGTAELGTITSADFKTPRRIWSTGNGSDWYQSTKMDINQYVPNQTFNETHPYFFMQGDNIIGRKPNEKSGTLRMTYYKLSPIISDDVDEIPVSMRGYTKSFVDYSLAQALSKDGKTQDANSKERNAYGELERFKKEITPRVRTGATYIDLVEAISADEDSWWF